VKREEADPVSDAKVNPDGALKGRVAVVTGASRGIGEAIARRLAMEGAKVVVSARTVEQSEHPLPGTITDTVNRIRAAGGEAHAVKCDISRPEDRKRLIEETVATYGPVDILVNNAAVTYYIPIKEFPEKRMRLMFEVQVFGPIELSQMVYPGMKERGGGHIIYISSGAASIRASPIRRAAGAAARSTGCARRRWNASPRASPRRSSRTTSPSTRSRRGWWRRRGRSCTAS
jgi:NAD(P)-dependent dehydrogenase (short-subunit alcohol dehydrogenase family)